MTVKKCWIGLLTGLAGIGVAFCALALPAPTACLAMGTYGFESVSERFLIPANSNQAEKARYKRLIQEARERIASSFGEPDADPIVVFFNDPRAFWPLQLNLHGQAPSIGGRMCLIIGPDGQHVDIVAHEFMHAEMYHRVGPWRQFREIPAWFDEGVAMQVDYRERYDLNSGQLPDTTSVRELTSYREFFKGQNSYAAAKREVRDWLTRVGADTLYARLERLRNGEPFTRVVEP